MCSQKRTTDSTEAYSVQIERLKQALETAEAIVVGAGAGLSTSAGLTYDGPRFEAHFADFIEKYHFRDMYSAGFYPFPTLEERWAYWSRHIYYNRYERTVGRVYKDLLRLLASKNYFVITTNVDHCFQDAGFDKARLFYTQGDYGLWQCSVPCHLKTYDNEVQVRQMVETQKDLRIPEDLVPRCPLCQSPMTMNLRSDHRFVEDEGWHEASRRYRDFLNRHASASVLFLELGVGNNTPGIIKYPFRKMTLQNEQAVYASINMVRAALTSELADRSILISGDISEVIRGLLE